MYGMEIWLILISKVKKIQCKISNSKDTNFSVDQFDNQWFEYQIV